MDVKPALGINLKDYDPHKVLSEKLWRITEKIDGVRRLFFKFKDGEVRAYSRSGKADLWLNHITSHLELDNFPSNMVYDTELVDVQSYFSNEDSYLIRTKTMGKAAQQNLDEKEDLVAICFDMFRPGGDLTRGEDRHMLLTKTFKNLPLKSPIFQVPYYGVLNGNDIVTLTELMDRVTSQNKEGLMLMNLDAPYIQGRSKELIKVKRAQEFIGRVVDIELADKGTKIEGGISALICNVPTCTIPVRVGSGFTHAERLYFAENPPIGQAIEIEAFSRTGIKDDYMSLNMPIFKRVLIPHYNHTPDDKPLFKLIEEAQTDNELTFKLKKVG